MTISRGSEWRQWDLHVHTASSYDHKYKGEDSDRLLVDSWITEGISAVAITDHFRIDSKRIENLRVLAEDKITIFPGVELRTDKGSTNLHVIAIFPETIDLNSLENAFQSIMMERKAVAKESSDTIYWDFKDIVEFTEESKGILTIHTGDKSNGMDEEISNKTLFEMAIKKEYSSLVPILEVSNLKNIVDYKKKVFPHIGVKPIIICSDNHDPRNYERKERLWIKADTTFNGLIQVINHPEERVFIGAVPPKEDIANKRKSVYIESINVKKDDDARNSDSNWFNVDMPINKGLTVIIGNKGGGKSAFADIIGHLCESNSMEEASFLNGDRFCKGPQRYANDYSGRIKWSDGKETNYRKLSSIEKTTTTQYAQYLPQKFIERVCTDLEREFQDEINRVIFSYVDSTIKGDAKDLDELVELKAHPFNTRINSIKEEILDLNKDIITLENRLTSQYRKGISDSLEKTKEMLQRHLDTIPAEVKKPESKLSLPEQKELEDCDNAINKFELDISTIKQELTNVNNEIVVLTNSCTDIREVVNSINQLNQKLVALKDKYFESDIDLSLKFVEPTEIIVKKIDELKRKKDELEALIADTDNGNGKSIYMLMQQSIQKKKSLVEKADATEKAYQKYLDDLKQWEAIKETLIGSVNVDNTVVFYQTELKKIDDFYIKQYVSLRDKRLEKMKEIFIEKQKIVEIHSEVYKPIKVELETILKDMTEKVDFKASVVMNDKKIVEKLLNYVNHSFSGIFSGKDKAYIKMNTFIRDTDFSNIDNLIEFVKNVLTVVDENLDKSSDIVRDKLKFYETLFCLDYVGVEFNLNYAERDLKELSPGERGIVLLTFYLALNKGEEPLIIDQPEDNLDNESVYKKLVPCIIEAKKKRQVIIVTHNPNIAIACDAEQIIHCQIDKSLNEIKYTAGSIENEMIRQKIIDVLEGTKPAFTLRSKKYVF